jgi:hypothetical protein
MRKAARRLLQEVKNDSSIASGGFEASREDDVCQLSFILTSSYGGLDYDCDEDDNEVASP